MKTESRIRIPGNARKDTCRGCGKTIYFVLTEAGKWAPTNPDGSSHFATCLRAAFYRKRPESKAPEGMIADHREEYDERVGILSYEGGLSLPEAEAQAEAELRERYPSFVQGALL